MGSRRALLEVRLLGGWQLTFDGETLPPPASRHARLLLARLALRRGRAQPRSELGHLLYPDVPENRARRRLSHALWQVQDVLGELDGGPPRVDTPGDAVVLGAGDATWLDVEEFEERLDRVVRGDDPTSEVRELRRCVELYRGDLMAGSHEDWVLMEQQRLRLRHADALGRLVTATKDRGNFDEALTLARRLTHHEPLREDVHREVMRLHVLLGQQSLALEQYERCRSVLAEELEAEPSAETTALRDRIVASRTAEASPRAAVERLGPQRLVGRDAERARLVDELERTLAGERSAAFVEGEPGVGKTQLLAQVAEDARWRGFTVLWGSCAGPGRPYAALREALLPALTTVRVAQLRATVEPVWLAEAGRLLPPLAGGAAPRDDRMDGADAAERMRQALSRVITELAGLGPVALVVEDLHLADRATLAMLGTLARRSEPGRLLLLLSFRDLEARHDAEVWSALRELDRDARPLRMTLPPLTAFEVGRLLRDALGTTEVPAALVETVHRGCGGNPLYVLEVLRALRDRGALGPGRVEQLRSSDVPVTDDLRTLVADRVDRLGPGPRRVLEHAAVLGPEPGLEVLAEVVGADVPDTAAAVSELVRRNLLLDDGRLRFAHAATRRVVLDTLPARGRAAMHLAAADALEARGSDDVDALAAHLDAAGEPRRALPYLRAAAGRALGLHAHAAAAHHLRRAVAVAGDVLTPIDVRVALLLELEQVLDVLGERDEQREVLDRLAALGGDPLVDVEVGLRRATLLGHVEELTEAVALAGRTVAAVPDGHDGLRGRALRVRGQLLEWAGDVGRAAEVLREAVPLLGADGREEVRARYALGMALHTVQRFDEADEQLRAAATRAEEQGDEVGRVLALNGLATVGAQTGGAALAVERYREALAIARRVGHRHREGVALVNLGTLHTISRAPGPALEAFEAAAAVFGSTGDRRGLTFVGLNRAWLLHRWVGDDDRAGEEARSARRGAAALGSPALADSTCEVLAGIARRAGDHAAAATTLEGWLDAAEASGDVRDQVQALRGLVELRVATGEAVVALRHAEDALARAGASGLDEFVADLAALGALAAGRADAHEVAAGLAAEAERAVPGSAEGHRVHHHLACWLEEAGRGGASREHAEAAHRLLDEALAGLRPQDASRAWGDVPTHRAIAERARRLRALERGRAMARAGAPTGRPLRPDEQVQVVLSLAPTPPQDPPERRRRLLGALHEVAAHGARASVEDLATIFDVSPSTVRRDLAALRSQGHEVETRGSAAG